MSGPLDRRGRDVAKTRPLDRPAVVWGAVFVALGLAALLAELGAWTLDAGVLLPVLLIVAGIALTVTAFVGRVGSGHR